MPKKSLVVGNWKMELSYKGSVQLGMALKKEIKKVSLEGEVVVCPSFPSLASVAQELAGTSVQVGAQNVHWEERGAFTGAVSVGQIKPFASWCIVGHSEQRELTGESDEDVSRKVVVLLKYGIVPIICVGETSQERAGGRAMETIINQATSILDVVNPVALRRIVIAYEPRWAIGAGEPAQPDEAAEAMLLIRKLAVERFGHERAERLRIIYGGSVTPENITPFVDEPGIDGVLVGGVSVRPMKFLEIVRQYQG